MDYYNKYIKEENKSSYLKKQLQLKKFIQYNEEADTRTFEHYYKYYMNKLEMEAQNAGSTDQIKKPLNAEGIQLPFTNQPDSTKMDTLPIQLGKRNKSHDNSRYATINDDFKTIQQRINPIKREFNPRQLLEKRLEEKRSWLRKTHVANIPKIMISKTKEQVDELKKLDSQRYRNSTSTDPNVSQKKIFKKNLNEIRKRLDLPHGRFTIQTQQIKKDSLRRVVPEGRSFSTTNPRLFTSTDENVWRNTIKEEDLEEPTSTFSALKTLSDATIKKIPLNQKKKIIMKKPKLNHNIKSTDLISFSKQKSILKSPPKKMTDQKNNKLVQLQQHATVFKSYNSLRDDTTKGSSPSTRRIIEYEKDPSFSPDPREPNPNKNINQVYPIKILGSARRIQKNKLYEEQGKVSIPINCLFAKKAYELMAEKGLRRKINLKEYKGWFFTNQKAKLQYLNEENPLTQHIKNISQDDTLYLTPIGLRVDTQNEVLQNHYKKMCEMSPSSSVEACRLSKASFRQRLCDRYSGSIADRIMHFFSISIPEIFNFNNFVQFIQEFVNSSYETQMKLVFKVLDINNDGKVCENDLISLFQSEANELFINLFSSDVAKILKFFEMKKMPFEKNHLDIIAKLRAGSARKTPSPTPKRKSFYLNNLFSQNLTARTPSPDKPVPQIKTTAITPKREEIIRDPQFVSLEEFLVVPFSGAVPNFLDDFLFGMCLFKYKKILPSDSDYESDGDWDVDRKAELEVYHLNSKFSYEETENLIMMFKSLAYKHNRLLKNIFVTEGSLLEHFKSVFGYWNEFLCRQIYRLFTNGKTKVKIFLERFLDILFEILKGNPELTQLYAFRIYDSDTDGQLNILDINRFLSSVHQKSPMAEEIQKLSDFYVENQVLKNKRDQVLINFDVFNQIVPNSLIIEELRNVFLGPEGTPSFLDNTKLIRSEASRGNEQLHLQPIGLGKKYILPESMKKRVNQSLIKKYGNKFVGNIRGNYLTSPNQCNSERYRLRSSKLSDAVDLKELND